MNDNQTQLPAIQGDHQSDSNGLPQVDQQVALPEIPAQPVVSSPQSQALPYAAQTSVTGAIVDAPQLADDVDLIEKEWVVKAKSIIEKTRNNPSEQTKEINKFKASYVKSRYGKDLKVAE